MGAPRSSPGPFSQPFHSLWLLPSWLSLSEHQFNCTLCHSPVLCEVFATSCLEIHDPLLLHLGRLLLVVINFFAVPLQLVFPHRPSVKLPHQMPSVRKLNQPAHDRMSSPGFVVACVLVTFLSTGPVHAAAGPSR